MNSFPAGYQRRTTALQVISSLTTALALFAVFRVAADRLSADWIGVWSLVQGLFVVARISDSSAGANISRVIAVRLKNGTQLDLKNFIIGAVLIAGLPSLFLALLLTPCIGWYMASQFGDRVSVHQLWILTVLGMVNAAVMSIANILLAVCEGLFLLNFKSWVVIFGNIAGLAAVIPLIIGTGPAGIALVYILAGATQLSFAIVKLTRLARKEESIESSRIRAHVQSMWRENLQLSLASLIRLSFEPATKFMLSLFAPLAVIANFELALRVTTQVRVVFQSALQPLLAIGARDGDNCDGELRTVFLRNDSILAPLSIGAMVAQVLGSSAVQLIGLGSRDYTFVVFFALLAVGNALNTMGLSGYYWQLTSGSLSPLVRVQFIMAVLNVMIGALAVATHSAAWVVAGYSAAFAYGGLVSRSFLRSIWSVRSVVSITVVGIIGLASTKLASVGNPYALAATGCLVMVASLVLVRSRLRGD